MEIGAKRVNIGSTLHGLREAQPNSQVYHFRRNTSINLKGLCYGCLFHSQTAQTQHESLVINTVVSYRKILKMAMNIKDLYRNSGTDYRFEKIKTQRNFQ